MNASTNADLQCRCELKTDGSVELQRYERCTLHPESSNISKDCHKRQLQRASLRIASILPKIFFLYREQGLALEQLIPSVTNETITFDVIFRNSQGLWPLPDLTDLSKLQRKSYLAAFQCEIAPEALRRVIWTLLEKALGSPVQIQKKRVILKPGQPLKITAWEHHSCTCGRVFKKPQNNTECSHVLLTFSANEIDEHHVLDLTSAQYGWHEPMESWKTYKGERVESVLKSKVFKKPPKDRRLDNWAELAVDRALDSLEINHGLDLKSSFQSEIDSVYSEVETSLLQEIEKRFSEFAEEEKQGKTLPKDEPPCLPDSNYYAIICPGKPSDRHDVMVANGWTPVSE